MGTSGSTVKECLDTNWVSSVGSYVDRFEAALAAYVGAKYAVATVNGTAALHIALLVAGVERRRRGPDTHPDFRRSGQRHPLRRGMARVHGRGATLLADEPR